MALYLAPAALGLGDLVVTLPVVQELIARGETVYLVVRLEEHADIARRVPGLAGVRLEWELPECLAAGDRFVDLRDHPLEKVAWWGSKPWIDAYPDWTVEDILRTICGDKGITIDFLAPYRPLKFVRRPELFGKVLFVPGTAVSAKMWPADRWMQLSRSLNASVIGLPETAELFAPLPWFETPTLADALDAVSSCRAVISVDTGIMHLAVHQGVPTVGIFRGSPVYIRDRANFAAVVAAKACQQSCYDCEIDLSHHGRPAAGKAFSPNDWACQAAPGGSCMETIEVDAVLDALNALFNPARTRKSAGSPR
jgi:ADP-heptose:LPS heptosyltransferase